MSDLPQRRRVLIMGAAGRDFHNFLRCYRDDPQTEVVAFTATQIPDIAGRRYPASLAGPLYPDGIPIYPETALEALLVTSHVVVITKEDTAQSASIQQVKATVQHWNPHAIIIDAAMPLRVSEPQLITGKRVLVIEDGPTLTHGGMTYGAGVIAAQRHGAAELVDPRSLPLCGQRGSVASSLTGALPYARGSIAATLQAYPALQRLLPAMGYNTHQIAELAATIQATPCDTVLCGTPVDLRHFLTLHIPAVRVSYDLEETGQHTLAAILPLLTKRADVRLSWSLPR